MTKRTLEERFRAKVDVNGPTMPHMTTPCHVWAGGISSGGYGGIYFGTSRADRRMEGAHRVAFFLAEDRWPVPDALHRCDNRPCVRRDHLFEGTQAENMADMVRKGRHAAKIGADAVRRIRSLYASGAGTQVQIGAMFGITNKMVSRIVRGEAWRHVTYPLEEGPE